MTASREVVETFYRKIDEQVAEGGVSFKTRLVRCGIRGAQKRVASHLFVESRYSGQLPPVSVLELVFNCFYFSKEEQEALLKGEQV